MIETKRKGKWLELIVPPQWDGITIASLFKDIWKAPKKLTHEYRMNKNVFINEQIANWNIPLKQNDSIKIHFFTDEDYGVIPTNTEIDVLFEDDFLIVVNKPYNIKTHPNDQDEKDTLANAVAGYLAKKGEKCVVKHVHRLDQDTSGTILFAKHKLVGSLLDRMLEENEIRRTYTAVVSGIIKDEKGTVDAPIGRDRHHPVRRRVSPTGKRAITYFSVIKKDMLNERTYIECELETGRTHQIRVHLSHIGHPIVGDRLYGGSSDYFRQALHSVKIEFNHPITSKRIQCKAPIPWEGQL